MIGKGLIYDRNHACIGRRHLDVEEKSRLLAEWAVTLEENAPLTERGELGFPNPLIVPWCAKINELPGVCAVQSCQGHRKDNGNIASGVLWLRMDYETAARFDDEAFCLAAEPGIERVSRIYQAWGEEIATIDFDGNERGTLDQSMELILGFLEGIAIPYSC